MWITAMEPITLERFDEKKQLVGVCSLFDQRSERHPEALPAADPSTVYV
jgi:hypothetical protein